ncbi:unnamed protein product [Moneuplotes crassus]|uniref:LITAF domain-containing protein n=1 Tax=Euplotes crassus TaxID=5936 RepID=A0AAD1XL20_EUPCR|nr:unnamed protein product [Moneuplotes crassus]
MEIIKPEQVGTKVIESKEKRVDRSQLSHLNLPEDGEINSSLNNQPKPDPEDDRSNSESFKALTLHPVQKDLPSFRQNLDLKLIKQQNSGLDSKHIPVVSFYKSTSSVKRYCPDCRKENMTKVSKKCTGSFCLKSFLIYPLCCVFCSEGFRETNLKYVHRCAECGNVLGNSLQKTNTQRIR